MLFCRKKFYLYISLIFCIFLVSQSFPQVTSISQEVSPKAPPGSEYVDPTTREIGSTSYGWLLVRTVLILAVFIGAIYMIYRVMRRKSDPMTIGNDIVDVVTEFPLGLNRKVNVIKVVNEFFLLGVTQDNVSLISKIEDKEAIDRFKLELSKPRSKGSIFTDVLDRYLGRSGKGARRAGSPLDVTRKIKDKIRGL